MTAPDPPEYAPDRQAVDAAVSRARRASLFVGRVLDRDAEWADATTRDGFARPAVAVRARLTSALSGADDESAFQRAIRRFRRQELTRLAVRDIAGWASLDETLQGLSDLADAAIDATLGFVARSLSDRHGVPRDDAGNVATPIVLGMGKLGGRELNFSSDVDLIFAFTESGQTDGSRTIDNEEYFGKLARETARLLSAVTEDGFVYRVDTLLRPFGSVGASALSMDATELYYQAHGREWERYALIKARPVAGDCEAGATLLQALQPFVYRRYLDYTALDALRALKARIDEAAQARGAEHDLKLGPGGIRELEFIVQLFQLIRGGQDARLRQPGLRAVLAQLEALGLMSARRVQALDAGYVFLRRAENALQLYDDAQVHHLPDAEAPRAALCAALDLPDWAAFEQAFAGVREQVHGTFERLFDRDAAAPFDARQIEGDWHASPAELAERLRSRGYGDGAEILAERLVTLRDSRAVRALGEAGTTRMKEAVSQLLVDAAALDMADTAALRALEIVGAIGGRTPYLTLLAESARARAQLLRLVAASPRITQLLAQTPALLDTLLDSNLANEAPDREALRSELAQRAGGVDPLDTEASMSLLRTYRQEMTLRIAAADLSGALPLVQVSDRLTWLAEAIVAKALDDAHAQLVERYGRVLGADGAPAPFAIIGYGKFGSLELGYGSDLDLVFIYDLDDVEVESQGGARPLSGGEYFARLGQRVVQLLSAQTVSGRAYEIDLQLRPSGGSGLVVSRLSGWARYQRDSAWTWEHQALLRARPVAGDTALGDAIDRVRREVLTRVRDTVRLRHEVRDMRSKMRGNLERREPGRWDVKQGGGGLIDAEFLVQYLVLRDAAHAPSLIAYTDNWRQLDALVAAGMLSAVDADALVQAGRAYRNWLHRRAMQDADGLADEAQFQSERAVVRRLWTEHLESD